ncbi:hypothetical protein [Brevibacillus antibioticus]|nr:hypothetical protein [Brevibacillus antibioticus]
MTKIEKQNNSVETQKYTSPKLVKLGSVVQLTFGGSSNGGDFYASGHRD